MVAFTERIQGGVWGENRYKRFGGYWGVFEGRGGVFKGGGGELVCFKGEGREWVE